MRDICLDLFTVIFSLRMGTHAETYIHSLHNPEKDLALVDSPNIFFKDVKRCQKGMRHFVILKVPMRAARYKTHAKRFKYQNKHSNPFLMTILASGSAQRSVQQRSTALPQNRPFDCAWKKGKSQNT